MKNDQTFLVSTGTHAVRAAVVAVILCASLCGLPAAAGAPGCPPSLCPLPEPVGAGLTNRLTLFPGTSSVIHDNGPGDENPDCGTLRATGVDLPLAWVNSGSAVFSGEIRLQQPSAGNAGKMVITDASILSTGDPSGGGAPVDFVPQELPFACGAFYMPQATGFLLHSLIHGRWDADAADGTGDGMLLGYEEMTLTTVATTLDGILPVPDPAPVELPVAVYGPGAQSQAPHQVSQGAAVFGTYQQGEGVIGVKMDGVIPTGELFHFPNSFVTSFGELNPSAVPDGSMGSQPMTVAKLDPEATELSVSWDTSSCEGDAPGHKLIYGHELPATTDDVYMPTGAVCGIGALASPFTWSDTPTVGDGSSLLWWLMLADNGDGAEGSWGVGPTGVERDGPGPDGSSQECGVEVKSLVNTCGQ